MKIIAVFGKLSNIREFRQNLRPDDRQQEKTRLYGVMFSLSPNDVCDHKK